MMRRYVFGDGSFILMGDEGTIIQGVLAQVEKHQRDVEQFLTKSKAEKEANSFEIKCVLSNREKGVFTVKWTDGTVTMVTCQPGDDWDDEKALAMCFMKKALGNKGAFNDVMRDALKKMAVIPAKKKVVPAVEVAPAQANADFDEAMKKLENTAAEAGKNMKEAIAKLIGDVAKKEEKKYSVYLQNHTAMTFLRHFNDKAEMTKFVQSLAKSELGTKPFYYRTWGDENKTTIDFGSHSKYIVIEGISPLEWSRA